MNKMKELFKNRIVIGVICIVFAIIICFALTPLYNRALTQTIEVVVVSEHIETGERITEDKLSLLTVGGYNVPNNVAKSKESIIGAYASSPLHVGDYITPSKLRREPLYGNEYLDVLDGSLVAVSVTIKSFAAGLSDKLDADDIISLIVANVGDDKATIIPPELTYVRIIAVTDDNGIDMYNSNIEFNEFHDNNTETITLLVTLDQARLLVDIEQNASLHTALVYRGSKEKANEFLSMQADILAKIETDEISPTVIVKPKDKSDNLNILSIGSNYDMPDRSSADLN